MNRPPTFRLRLSLLHPRRHLRIAAGAPLAALLLAGCVVVPQTREVYDEECRMLTKKVVLETSSAERFQQCEGNECKALMVATGVVTAASAVVSGSIALAGNVLYWFERQGRCVTAPPATPATPASAASAASAASR